MLLDSCENTVIFVAALNPKEFVKFKVAEVHDVNHNTKIYRYAARFILVSCN